MNLLDSTPEKAKYSQTFNCERVPTTPGLCFKFPHDSMNFFLGKSQNFMNDLYTRISVQSAYTL